MRAPKITPEKQLKATLDKTLVSSPFSDDELQNKFGDLPLFQEYNCSCANFPSGKLKNRKKFDSFIKQQYKLFGTPDDESTIPPLKDRLEKTQIGSEKQMMAAHNCITKCCCCLVPLKTAGKGTEIIVDGEKYLRLSGGADGNSALRKSYKYKCPGGVKIWVNRPKSAAAKGKDNPSDSEKLPCILYLHGGAVCTTGASYQFVARKLCMDLNAVVINVDFRLPGGFNGQPNEEPVIGAVLDTLAILNWVFENAGQPWGVGKYAHKSDLLTDVDKRRISINSTSGGNLIAVGLALELAERGEGEKIKTIFTDVPMIFAENVMDKLGGDSNRSYVEKFWHNVCYKQMWDILADDGSLDKNDSSEKFWEDRENHPEMFLFSKRVMDILNNQHNNPMPDFCILTAEFDMARYSTDLWADKLNSVGKLLDYVIMPGMSHTDINGFEEAGKVMKKMFALYG